MAVLDTSALIDLTRSQLPVGRRASALLSELVRAGEPLCTTRFNLAELWIGIELSTQRAAEIAKVEAVTQGLPILEFDESAMREFANIAAVLRRLGKPVGDMDALIAAVAVSNGQSLVTRNPKHFADIGWLSVRGY